MNTAKMTKQELRTEVRDFYKMLDILPEHKTVSLADCNRLDELKKELNRRV
jgi:hypothetical protein|tara:strand:+ start:385 stop:537 length:153 start_codon:yes stop_codon:yes gene_type:complete